MSATARLYGKDCVVRLNGLLGVSKHGENITVRSIQSRCFRVGTDALVQDFKHHRNRFAFPCRLDGEMSLIQVCRPLMHWSAS